MSGYLRATVMLALCWAVLGGSAAYACSCIEPMPPQEAFARYDAVFAGVAVEVNPPEKFTNERERKTTLKVETAWKGVADKVVTLTTSSQGSACGYFFEKGERYLVYATEDPSAHILLISSCSRTRKLADAEEDLAALGPGIVPASSGDVNRDGRLTVQDATAVLRALVGLATLDAAQALLADINDDGSVDVTDAQAMLRQLVN